jgi:hypothetical protein
VLDGDCKTKHDVSDEGHRCAEEFARYQAVRATLPDATYVLRAHPAIQGCDP